MTEFEVQKIRDSSFCSGYNFALDKIDSTTDDLLSIVNQSEEVIKLGLKAVDSSSIQYMCEFEDKAQNFLKELLWQKNHLTR